jgi:hypothetical protein
MWSFMTSGSLIEGAKPDGSDATPLPKENNVMMIFEGSP